MVAGSHSGGGGGGPPDLTEDELKQLQEFYYCRLLEMPDKRDWLHRRGLTDWTIHKARLGHTGRAYSIPIWEYETFHTIRFRRDDGQTLTGSKYWGLAGRNQVYLYHPNPHQLAPWEGKLVITEGEYDCLVACQLGYRAITWTNGIGSFDLTPWLDRFQGVGEVVIATDQDGPGYEGAINVSLALQPAVPKVRIPHWANKDLTDLYLAKGEGGIRKVLGEP